MRAVARGDERPGPQASAYLLSDVGGLPEAERLRQQARALLSDELPLILAQAPQGGVLIDLGCGSGLLADALAEARPDLQVYGVDADALAVAEATRVYGARPGLSFLQRALEAGPGGAIPKADLCLMRLVLMHLPEPVSALRQCQAWVKPGATLLVAEGDDRAIVMDPEPEWLPELLKLMQTIQTRRAGSRRLGLQLGALLGSAAWALKAEARAGFSLSALGATFPAVFVPVAKFYLAQAVSAGLIMQARASELEALLMAALQGGLKEAVVPLFYASGSMD